MNDLFYAAKEKIVQEHDVIDEAICEEAKVGKRNRKKIEEVYSLLFAVGTTLISADSSRYRDTPFSRFPWA